MRQHRQRFPVKCSRNFPYTAVFSGTKSLPGPFSRYDFGSCGRGVPSSEARTCNAMYLDMYRAWTQVPPCIHRCGSRQSVSITALNGRVPDFLRPDGLKAPLISPSSLIPQKSSMRSATSEPSISRIATFMLPTNPVAKTITSALSSVLSVSLSPSSVYSRGKASDLTLICTETPCQLYKSKRYGNITRDEQMPREVEIKMKMGNTGTHQAFGDLRRCSDVHIMSPESVHYLVYDVAVSNGLEAGFF